jgi:HK97 family phage portal protein
MGLISLNLHSPGLEKRDGVNLNQAGVSLAAGLAALGMGTFTDSNETVNERTSFEVPTYLTCIRILSESIGSLPLRVYEKMPRGQRPAPSHYLYYLLTERPNPQMSATVFFQTLMTAAAGWGNAYAKIERDSSGARPVALWPLSPWKTKPVRKNGLLTFETTDTADGLPATIKSDDMLHIIGFSFDGLQGTAFVKLARQCIGLALVAARFGARFYANGARNSFFLQADHDLSPEELTEMRLDVEALSTGANAWRVANLPNGVKIVPVETDPNALSEYTTTSKYTRDEIAAFMRVPGYMVGSTEKILKSTVEAQNREFLSYSLTPWLSPFIAYTNGGTEFDSQGTSSVVINNHSTAGTGGLIVYGGGANYNTAAFSVGSNGSATVANNLAVTNHLNQAATKDFAGTCAMSSTSTCTVSLQHSYSSTPLCFVQATTNNTTGVYCAVSSNNAVVTAAATNSLTWQVLVIGNPN